MRKVTNRADRVKEVKEVKGVKEDILLIPSAQQQLKPKPQPPEAPKPPEAPEQLHKSLAQLKKEEILKHRKMGLNYYYKNKEKVLAKLRLKRLEQSKQKAEQKISNIDKKIEEQDNKTIDEINANKG